MPILLAAVFTRRRLRLALALAVGLVIAVRLALPWSLARLGERLGGPQIGRVVEIGDVDLELLRGRAQIEGLVVGPLRDRVEDPHAPIDAEQALLRFERLALDWSWTSLLRGEPHILDITLEGPRLVMLRDESGRLVPIAVPPEAPEPVEPEPEGEPLPVSLDALRIADLELLLIDLAHPERRPLDLSMQELTLRDLRVAGGAIELGGLSLRHPTLKVLRNANFDTQFEGAAQEAESAAAEPAGPPPSLEIARIEIADADLSVDSAGEELAARLSLSAEGVSLREAERFPVTLRLEVGDGSVELAGRAGAVPPAFEGTLRWKDLELPPLLRVADPEGALRLAAGRSSGQLELVLAPGAVKVSSGRVQLLGFDGVDREERVALAWKSLEIALDGLTLTPPREGQEAVSLSLAQLDLNAADLELVDHTLSPPQQLVYPRLEVHGSGLLWPGPQVSQFDLALDGAQQSRATARGSLGEGSGRVKLDLVEIQLPTYAAQVARAAGYQLTRGALTLDATVELQGEEVDLKSKVLLRDLRVDELNAGRFEQTFGMPLDLALALLRDPFGRISLPISGRFQASGGGVDLAPLLVATLRQALLGAVTTPLKSVGFLAKGGAALVGGIGAAAGGLRLDPLATPPGEATPSDLEPLSGLAQLLDARPQLALVLRGRAGPSDDPPLARRMLAEAARGEGELPPVSAGFLQRRRLLGALEDWDQGEPSALDELDAEDAEVLARWAGAVEVPEQRRLALAQARAELVRERLAQEHGVDPSRLRIGEPLSGDPAVVVQLAAE